MDSNNIYELVEKYWACETTSEEERLLKQFFTTDEVPADLAAYKAWFSTASEEIAPLGKSFDEQILSQIAVAEKPSAVRPTFIVRHWMQVAALFILLFTCTFFIHHYQTNKQQTSFALLEDTFDNPEEALAAVRNALYFASEELNRGLDLTAEGFHKAEPALEIIKTN